MGMSQRQAVTSDSLFMTMSPPFHTGRGALLDTAMGVNGTAGMIEICCRRSGLVHTMPYFCPFYIIKTRVESAMDNCYSFHAHYDCDIVMALFSEALRGDLSCTVTR
jgi:hypothetical protein